jgi:DNA replicative helicase MCM subunit Mcm2 (Cdc46/Mcm family)
MCINHHSRVATSGAPPASEYTSMDDAAPPLDQAILKQYIKYARAFVKPILREVDSEKVGGARQTDSDPPT